MKLAEGLFQECVRVDDPAANDAWMTVDLTMPQLKVLMKLVQQGPQPVGALAQSLGVSAPTASGILQRLVRSGHVRRTESSDDRRVSLIALTSRGSAVFQRLFAAQQEVLARAYGKLTTTELSTVIRALELLVKGMKASTIAQKPTTRRRA